MKAASIRAARYLPPLLLVVGVLLAFVLAYNARIERDYQKQTAGALRRALAEKQDRLAHLAAYTEQLAQMRTTLAQLMRRLPAAFDEPGMRSDLRERAQRAGAEIDTLSFGPETRKGFYAVRPADIVLHGSTAKIGAFLADVPNDAQLQLVTKAQIVADDRADTLRASLNLVYYRYVDEGE